MRHTKQNKNKNKKKALENDETMKIFVRHLRDLKSITNKFLNAIVESLPKMPYGIRNIANVMYNDLRAKFPDADEELIIKTVGNLIYYRYMNPAVVYVKKKTHQQKGSDSHTHDTTCTAPLKRSTSSRL